MKLFGKPKDIAATGGRAPGQKLVSEERRRLSTAIAGADGLAIEPGGKVVNVSQLKNKPMLEALDGVNGGGPARRGSFVISSAVTENQDSFDDKQTVTEGSLDINHQMLKDIGIGIRCKKGFKPEAPNQDSFSFVRYEDEFDLFGVFDGHGIYGHAVSQFVREMLPKVFLRDSRRDKSTSQTKQALIDAFASVQKMIEEDPNLDARTSGTTATLAYRPSATGDIYIAHCGDSRAIMIEEKKGKPCGIELTKDHKPNTPAERQRIENGGGCVIFDGFYNHRVFKRGTVYPGLNMSRAMGDVIGHKEAGITQMPDVKVVNPKNCIGLLMCSDGVWEFISNDEAASIVCGSRDENREIDPAAGAENLTKESWNRWMEDTGGEVADDITAVVHLFSKKEA
jgi:serine/threonine protein phosphatase PrpC